MFKEKTFINRYLFKFKGTIGLIIKIQKRIQIVIT
jgi:hypothetical protein